ncbi:MAG: class I SAM-dependent methyltransferase [Fimbriiglobus sp.]
MSASVTRILQGKDMFFAWTDRENLVRFLPSGGVGGEIGVAQGDFAAHLLQVVSPKEIHLIDPWSHLESDTLSGLSLLEAVKHDPHSANRAPAHNSLGDEQFRVIQARFATDPRVRLHRQFSYKAFSTFPDSYFDFLYIDGNHTYEFVLRDLLDYAPKVKPDGLILGHDFFHNNFADRENYGVIPAVQTFLKRTGYQFLALTSEPFSSYVLTRQVSGYSANFVQRLVNSQIPLLRLPTSLTFSYRDLQFPISPSQTKRIPSFE